MLETLNDVLLDLPMVAVQCPPGTLPGQICYVEERFPFGQYRFSVMLKNWVGAYAMANISLTKTRFEVPSLVIGGERVVEVPRHQELIVSADAKPSACGSTSDAPLTFTWSMTPSPFAENVEYPRGRTLIVAPHVLTIGMVYTVTVSVAQGSNPRGNVRPTHSVQVKVIPSKPVPIIATGDRLVSLFDKTANFTLDASASFSPDFGLKIRGSATILWTCGQNLEVGGIDLGYSLFPCRLIAADSHEPGFDRKHVMKLSAAKIYEHLRSFTTENDDFVTFTEGCDNVGSIPQQYPLRCDPTALYQFTAHVCDISNGKNYNCSGLGSNTSASASVVWSTTPLPAVNVGILPLDQTRILRVMQLNLVGVIPPDRLKRQPRYAWTQIQPVGFNVLKSSNILVFSTYLRNLVLKSGVLQGSDPYTFRLYATYDQTADLTKPLSCTTCGWAQITVYQNLPPSSGTLSVIPKRGVALETKFRLTATQWVDPPLPQDDYPLTYTFGYYDENSDPKYLKVNSPQSTNTMVLPYGTQAFSPDEECSKNVSAPEYSPNCGYLRLLLEVSDSLGASGTLGEQVLYFCVCAYVWCLRCLMMCALQAHARPTGIVLLCVSVPVA